MDHLTLNRQSNALESMLRGLRGGAASLPTTSVAGPQAPDAPLVALLPLPHEAPSSRRERPRSNTFRPRAKRSADGQPCMGYAGGTRFAGPSCVQEYFACSQGAFHVPCSPTAGVARPGALCL